MTRAILKEFCKRLIEKLPNTLPPSTYTVTTPTAIISVEQTDEATDFVIQAASTAQSSVSVIWGAVLVKSLTEGIAVERIVKSCQMVYVDEGKEPSPVIGVSPETLKKLMELTTIPGTLPDKVPSCKPTERQCPCPWGFARDPDDEQCKPCASGASYDESTCSCACGHGPGYFDPITGTLVEACPTQAPFLIPGFSPPDPNVLPHEGCARCACCPEELGCYTSTPNDGSCAQARCGLCEPSQALPAQPGTNYPCPKCCECDQGGTPDDPCGINAAGFPIDTPCGVGLFPGKCIAQSDCEANGGFFVQTSDVGGFPCFICQEDEPQPYVAATVGDEGGPCKKRTWRYGEPEYIPKRDGYMCYSEGECGRCEKGECVKLPPCPEDQPRNARCQCIQPPAPPPAECTSEEECREKTSGARPCCREGQCTTMQLCPDGSYRCTCEPLPCDQCNEKNEQGRCVPCDELGMDCDEGTGKCVPKTPPSGAPNSKLQMLSL